MSLLIKNGTVYDGTGRPPFKGDILVRGSFVAGVGEHKKFEAEKIIDAEGSMVTPGFIDVNSGSDRLLYVLSDSLQNNLIDKGITTSVIGTCGLSLAPILGGSLDFLREKWGAKFTDKLNIDWHTFEEFTQSIERRGTGVNIPSFVGHLTVRNLLTNGELRELTNEELSVFKKIISESFDEGAIGLSFGLEFGYSQDVSYKEIKELCSVASKYNKPVSVHIREPEHIKDSFKEIKRLVKDTGVSIIMNHLQPPKNSSVTKDYKEVREEIENMGKNQIRFDCYLGDFKIVPIYKFLPKSIRSKRFDEIQRIISKKNNEEEIINHLKKIVRKRIIISQVPPSLNFFEGKTIKEFADNCGLTQSKSLLEVMRLSKLNAVCLYEDVNKKELYNFLNSELSFIGSDGIYLSSSKFNPFIEFLNFVEDKGEMTTEQAISKITSEPAKSLNIKNRGILKEGYYADINIINNKKIKDILINGELIKNDYKLNNSLMGKVIKTK